MVHMRRPNIMKRYVLDPLGMTRSGMVWRPEFEAVMANATGVGWSLGFGIQTDRNGQAHWQWGDYGIFRNYIIAYRRDESKRTR
jgi:CubicO group peptidase (beta-lactamase class C family)